MVWPETRLARDFEGIAPPMHTIAVEFSRAPAVPQEGAAPAFDSGDLAIATGLAGLESEWRALEASAAGHVFQTYDFLAAWFAHVGAAQGVAPRIVVGRCRRGTTLFLLPFAVRRWLGRAMVEWAGGDQADYQGGLFAPSYLAALGAGAGRGRSLVDRVVELLKGEADILHFRRQPALIGGLPNPFAAFRPIPHAVRSHHTRLGADWDAYYHAKRNSASRRADRAKLHRLAAAGEVRFFDATTPAEARRVMDALFRQKAGAFSSLGIPNFLACPGVEEFCRSVAENPWPKGPSHLAAVEVGGEIVAANWGLVSADRYYYVLHSYERGPASRDSPGRQLMYYLMRWSIDRGIGLFDFTIGDEDFKSQWCEETADLFDSVVALGPRGLDLALLLRAAKAGKRRIKADPRARALFEALRRLAPLR